MGFRVRPGMRLGFRLSGVGSLLEDEVVQQLFLTSAEARLLVDRKGTIRFATPAAAGLLGFKAGELTGSGLARLLPGETVAGLIPALGGAFPEGRQPVRLDFIDSRGRHLPWRCVLHPLTNEGRPGLLLIRMRLETDELNREMESLRRRLELLSEMADIVPAIFWVQNRQGSDISYVNRAYQDVYGVPGQTLIDDSSSWLRFVHPEDLPKVSKIWKDSPPDRSEIEFRIVRPDGAVRWVIDTYIPVFDENDEIVRKVGFGVDVTALKLVQNELQAKETELREQAGELEKLNTALQVLVEHREKEIRDTEANLNAALVRLVKPYVRSLLETGLDRDQRVYADILASNLDKITSAFAKRAAAWQAGLSPMEIKVADMVLNGKTTKEISEVLSVSLATVSFHRHNIRKKLGIENQKVNLQSHLRSLST